MREQNSAAPAEAKLKAPRTGLMLVGWEAASEASSPLQPAAAAGPVSRSSRTADRQVHRAPEEAVDVAVEVQCMLGASRSGALAAACHTFARDLRQGRAMLRPRLPVAGPGDYFKGGNPALLQALGAPGFTMGSALAVEDDVYGLLTDPRLAEQVPDMLAAHTDISGFDRVCSMLTALAPKCAVPEAVLRVIFEPQVEREKMLLLSPRPLHYAVLHSSGRLVRMILAAAARANMTDVALEKAQWHDGRGAAPSPLLLASLFAGEDVAEALRVAGAAPNEIDARAAMRLQRAKLWEPLAARMQSVGLGEAAKELERRVQEAREKAAQARAATRAVLLGLAAPAAA